MEKYEGNILQVIKEDMSLQDILNPKFLEKIKEEFDDEEIMPINIKFISFKKQPKSLTLFYPSHKHTKDKKLVVDVDFPEDLDKLYNSLNFND